MDWPSQFQKGKKSKSMEVMTACLNMYTLIYNDSILVSGVHLFIVLLFENTVKKIAILFRCCSFIYCVELCVRILNELSTMTECLFFICLYVY